jgi:hypothetical protein
MKFLATLALIWVAILLIGAIFGVLGKVIWLGVLATAAVWLWNYIEKKDS